MAIEAALAHAGIVEPCSDGAELLELCKEILDEVTRLVKLFVILALVLAIGFGRDDDALSERDLVARRVLGGVRPERP
jgi:hypothetical protein